MDRKRKDSYCRRCIEAAVSEQNQATKHEAQMIELFHRRRLLFFAGSTDQRDAQVDKMLEMEKQNPDLDRETKAQIYFSVGFVYLGCMLSKYAVDISKKQLLRGCELSISAHVDLVRIYQEEAADKAYNFHAFKSEQRGIAMFAGLTLWICVWVAAVLLLFEGLSGGNSKFMRDYGKGTATIRF